MARKDGANGASQRGAPATSGITVDPVSSRARCIAEVVHALIKAYDEHGRVNVNQLKLAASERYGLAMSPKLMELIAAVPEEYRDKLAPFLRAKPVRTASGIAVVAVMSKPHRCPHIALTGSVCVYW